MAMGGRASRVHGVAAVHRTGQPVKGICGMDNHVTSILKRLDKCEHD